MDYVIQERQKVLQNQANGTEKPQLDYETYVDEQL